jgi:hypothetical protein
MSEKNKNQRQTFPGSNTLDPRNGNRSRYSPDRFEDDCKWIEIYTHERINDSHQYKKRRKRRVTYTISLMTG